MPRGERTKTAELLRAMTTESSGGCWAWGRSKLPSGYGVVSHEGRQWLAHRLMFVLSGYWVTDKQNVCHRCDNPSCINPGHLFAGTQSDNIKDMVAKGRGNAPAGESHWRAKVTAEQVAALRAEYAAGGVSQSFLATKFGLCQKSISYAINNRTWRNAQ